MSPNPSHPTGIKSTTTPQATRPRGHESGALRGLTTLALIQAQYDSGEDHIGMFMPIVLDAVRALSADDFATEDAVQAAYDRFGLSIPATTMQVLLGRASKKRFLSRNYGRYFKLPQLVALRDLLSTLEGQQHRFESLGDAFVRFAQERGVSIASLDDALGLIFGFLEANQVALLLETPAAPKPLRGSKLKPDEYKLVAEFLLNYCQADDQLATAVRDALIGFVLQNALFLRDIGSSRRRFIELRVFLDTGVLLDALGYGGKASETASIDSLRVIRDAGAELSVFEDTIREMKSILQVYEVKLATPDGQRTLRPTPLTRYFLTSHFTPSAIRGEIALMRSRLQALGIRIHERRKHKIPTTLDEAALAKSLVGEDGQVDEQRIVHDVDCVAAILTFRGEQVFESLDNAKAVFASNSGLVVRSVRDWYQQQGEGGISPIVHFSAISNIAWLKKPASAADLPMHTLAAICAASLRPSRKLWDRFLAQLRVLRTQNRITSEEEIAVLASDLTDSQLMLFDSDHEPDANTLTEVVERVKQSHIVEAQAELATVQEALRVKERDYSSLQAGIARFSGVLAVGVSWFLAAVVSVLVVWGLVVDASWVPLPTALKNSPIALIARILCAGVGVAGSFRGFAILVWRTNLETRLRDAIAKALARG